MDWQAFKERSKLIWGTGDYAPTSRQLEPVSEALVDRLGIADGQRVLDVASGHGNCALAAARRGAHVVASDLSPVMVDRGRERTRGAGVDVEWKEADAADLPFEDDRFDRVTSVFGAIFAPEQDRVARELVRVAAPGGRVGLTAWTPDGVVAGLVAVRAEHGAAPLPEGLPSPFGWGDPDHVEQLFDGLGVELELSARTCSFTYPSWDAWRQSTGVHGMPLISKQTMDPDAYDRMIDALQAYLTEHDHGEGDAVVYDAEYLEIVVSVRG